MAKFRITTKDSTGSSTSRIDFSSEEAQRQKPSEHWRIWRGTTCQMANGSQ